MVKKSAVRLLPLGALSFFLLGCSAQSVPDSALKQYMQGEDFYVRGQVEAALAIFSRVSAAHPRFHQAAFMQGKSLYMLNRPKEAETVLTALLAREPRYHEAGVWLARIRVQQGEIDSAETLLSQLLSFDSQDARLLYLMAQVRSDQGRLQDAITYLQKAGATEEDLARVHIELGRLYYRFSLGERARTELMRALSLLPDGSPLQKPVVDLLTRVSSKE